MPRVTRRRRVGAPVTAVWELVSDPYNLPRWWPRTMRVESVEGEGADLQWTKVLGTTEGRGVRADFRCIENVAGERFGWEQLIPGTPFERHLRRYEVEVSLSSDKDGETAVTLAATQTLRGLSRLGSPMMRRGQGALLDEALDGLERALT
ncbi:MAG TPA: SRPBCC family protein [Solirubrobacterales bacterium]|nr:SRPBCC family protein [Solirubrobacterales bacterium]